MPQAQTLKNGDALMLASLPAEATAQVPKGKSLRLMLEEQPGQPWSADHNPAECDLALERRPGWAALTVTSHVQTPARIELACGAHATRLLVYTIAAQQDISPLYPRTPVLDLLRQTCRRRGITLTDWHLHIRGGMTPQLAADRELDSGIRSSAMENHGREWEIYDNARLRDFAANARKVSANGHLLPVGIQVNDRDWASQIDPETRAQFDYILADTMIMGKLPSGRDNRLWLDQTIPDPQAWMNDYLQHNLRILDEPISILANPTYLPKEIAAAHDELWTAERMKAVIAAAVERGVALEIQAGSPFPRPAFLRLPKSMGAAFSFGTNNFDPTPKDLSRWLEAIEWLDLSGDDIWTPERLRSR